MIIASAGHVDHGKTLLVHSLTGIETDRLEEEKSRGLTIDLGFAYLHRAGKTIGFVDVPGHTRFISNMLTGVSSIDFAMLVIAADDGPMPQTMEHLAILSIMGISQGCIALTKIDRVDENRLAEVKREIRILIDSSKLNDSPIFEVSSTTGQGIDALSAHLWQSSESLATKQSTGHFRLAIDRCFNIKGSGVVVTGSVFSGTVKVGDELHLHPGKKLVRVRSIHRQNEDSTQGFSGDRCAINISGDVNRDTVSRGNWLSSNVDLPLSDRIDISFRLLESETKPLKHLTPVHVHVAAQHVTGRLVLLESKTISPGQVSFVQLILSQAINLCYGDRIVIRDQAASRTLGGAQVIDPFAPPRGLKNRLAQLNALMATSIPKRLDRMLEAVDSQINVAEIKASFNLEELDTEAFGHISKAGILYSKHHVKNGKKETLDALRKWHRNFPSGKGPTQSQLRNLCQLPLALLEFILELLIREKAVKKTGNEFQALEYQNELPAVDKAFWLKVKPLLENELTKPPVLHELARSLNLPPTVLDKRLKGLIAFNLVIKPVKNRFFLPEGISRLKLIAISVSEDQEDNKFTVINFRDKSLLGRNLCIEILEYFDQIGFTLRQGDFRIIQDLNR
ncbi:MAG: selenocysteine-specific translation elongation factor [Pseudomonadales bacterium]|nr:selenocysteine-specific translation elongation factor [Pseudomonadales bacterium]